MQQPLLIIYTGGTIGMQSSSVGYQASEGIQALIEANLSQQAIAQLCPYQVHEFDRLIDSSNAQPNDWLQIAQCISDNYAKYAGFIVLHGTDTMAYTAAALHHMLGTNIKPVIVTGSQIPLCEPRSDGASNLIEAALFSRSNQLSQVALSFAGKLLAGNSAKKVHSSALAAFNSLNVPLLARADINLEFVNQSAAMQPETALTTKMFKLANFAGKNVAVLYLYPGISNTQIEAAFDKNASKAVVMLSFGAGNPPDQNSALMSALKKAQQANMPVFNMTQCYSGAVSQGTYAVGSALNELGVISAGSRTLEDVVTDLYINVRD